AGSTGCTRAPRFPAGPAVATGSAYQRPTPAAGHLTHGHQTHGYWRLHRRRLSSGSTHHSTRNQAPVTPLTTIAVPRPRIESAASSTALTIETTTRMRPPNAIRWASRTSIGLRWRRNTSRWYGTGPMIRAVAPAVASSATR